MIRDPNLRGRPYRPAALSLGVVAALTTFGACTHGGGNASMSPTPRASMSVTPAMAAPLITAPSPDPRVGLKAGLQDAGSAIWNLRLVSHTPSPEHFAGITNSDLAFTGANVIQGNYNGFQIWDISNPTAPRLRLGTVCPASQSDVSVYRNLLFVSAEAPTARLDCGADAPKDPVSKDRIRGVRIFDITDIDHPVYKANVQTCRGSHTHTVVHDPKDNNNVYIYISGTSSVRPSAELAGCSANLNDPNTALFRIEVIKVPLAHPEAAAIVSSPRIFADANGKELINTLGHGASPADANMPPAPARPPRPVDPNAPPAPPRGTLTQCHDITVYPDVGLAGGACAGMGLLLDIHDVAHPRRVAAVADSNFSFWHSATFSNDGSMILFSDEWGGGGAPYCRAQDPKEWGADAIFTIDDSDKMHFKNYYKMPAPQTPLENCVAHNGSLIPIPGRTIMVQSWYQGGISVFEWTDPSHPHEIAFFDRGPNDSTRARGGGFWSSYWYNGHIVGSEMQRGLDIFELTPSAAISQNEIDAAKSVRFAFLNVQDQPKFVWPASFALSRSYVDQLERWHGLSSAQVSSVRDALRGAESSSGDARRSSLGALAGTVDGYAGGSSDPSRVHLLSQSLRELANAR